jgi:hypothetical protein
MAESKPDPKAPKGGTAVEQPSLSVSQQAYGDGKVEDDTPFPVPELYFQVFDSGAPPVCMHCCHCLLQAPCTSIRPAGALIEKGC